MLKNKYPIHIEIIDFKFKYDNGSYFIHGDIEILPN